MRCLIVDDSTVFLDAARRVLDSDDVYVVGVASNLLRRFTVTTSCSQMSC